MLRNFNFIYSYFISERSMTDGAEQKRDSPRFSLPTKRQDSEMIIGKII